MGFDVYKCNIDTLQIERHDIAEDRKQQNNEEIERRRKKKHTEIALATCQKYGAQKWYLF